MSKKGKQFTILLAVCAVLLTVYCVILIVNSLNEKKQEEIPVERVINLEDIVEISFFNGSETYDFYLDGETWIYKAIPDFPISNSYVQHISSTALELVASREFEIADSLESYGLANPAKNITVTDSAGNAVTLEFGNAVDDTYYAMQPGGDIIYVIPSDLVEAVSFELYDMIELEETPTVREKTLDSFTITAGGSTVTFEKETVTEEVEKTDEETGQTTTEEETVYHWYATYNNGKRLPVEDFNEKFTSSTVDDLKVNGYIDYLMKSLNYYSITSCENYKASEEEFSAFGFDEPTAVLTVNYTKNDEQLSYTLNIGSYFEVEVGDESTDDSEEVETEGYYYVNLEGSQAINHMLAEHIDRFLIAMDELEATA